VSRDIKYHKINFMLPKVCVYLNCYHICQKPWNFIYTFKYQTYYQQKCKLPSL